MLKSEDKNKLNWWRKGIYFRSCVCIYRFQKNEGLKSL